MTSSSKNKKKNHPELTEKSWLLILMTWKLEFNLFRSKSVVGKKFWSPRIGYFLNEATNRMRRLPTSHQLRIFNTYNLSEDLSNT